jgi:hypothetical protein
MVPRRRRGTGGAAEGLGLSGRSWDGATVRRCRAWPSAVRCRSVSRRHAGGHRADGARTPIWTSPRPVLSAGSSCRLPHMVSALRPSPARTTPGRCSTRVCGCQRCQMPVVLATRPSASGVRRCAATGNGRCSTSTARRNDRGLRGHGHPPRSDAALGAALHRHRSPADRPSWAFPRCRLPG